MTTKTLADRVERLEEQVRTLLEKDSAQQSTPTQKDWRRSVGMFRDDPVMEEIIVARQRIREADRREVES